MVTAMAGQDPLFLLRDFLTSDRLAEVIEDGGDIVFGNELRVPKDMKTSYKDRSQNMHISILSAVILAKNPVRYKYISEMNKRKQAKLIGASEMIDLNNFLTGKTDDSAAGNIERSSVAGEVEKEGVERGAKRARSKGTSGSSTGIGWCMRSSVPELHLRRV